MKRALVIGGIGLVLLVAAVAQTLWHAWNQPSSAPMPSPGQPARAGAPLAGVADPAAPSTGADVSTTPRDGFDRPSFDVVRVNPDGDAVIAGRAAPSSQVTVYDGDRVIGTITADQRGEWVLLPQEPLPPGSRELSVTARSGDEVEPVPSEQVVVLIVPGEEKDIAGRPADGGTGALAVAVPRDGVGAATALQVPIPDAAEEMPDGADGRPIASDGVTVDIVSYDQSGDVSIGGRAAPGSPVQIYLDNALLGTTTTDEDGQWRLTPDRRIEPGRYSLRADQVGTTGTVVARAETPFQMTEVPEGFTGDRAIIVQPGNSLWRIARRTYGQGIQFTLIYAANRNQIRDPDLIYPGQIFSLPPT